MFYKCALILLALIALQPNARADAWLIEVDGAIGPSMADHFIRGLEQAEAVLNGAPAEISDASELEAARAQLALAGQAASAGPLQELMAAVEANPADKQARLDLAVAMHANGDTAQAVDVLLALFAMDREWNDGAAKAQMFTIFDALPANDPVVLNGRRRLSSMIFA